MAEQSPPPLTLSAAWRLAVLACVVITVWRLMELFGAPINLSFDEAQYWGWAQQPDWGYFSKPPMVAWMIWLTTALGGSDAEPWVRLSAPLSHVITALSLFMVGRQVAPRALAPQVALWSAIIWITIPGVAVSAMIVSTDAYLLMFWALALAAYGQAVGSNRPGWWAVLGLWVGLGLMSKYAMLFFLIGGAIHHLWDADLRQKMRHLRAWSGPAIMAVLAGAIYFPNWLWNRAHGFASYHHTSENANLDQGPQYSFGHLAEFIGSQFGVFGPFLFATLLVLLLWRLRSALRLHPALAVDDARRVASGRKLLLALTLPPLALITVQAFLSRANANWAATAYVAATPLVVCWLLQSGKPWQHLLKASVILHVVASVILYDLESIARTVGVTNPARYDLQKRVRGWDDAGEWLREVKAANPDATLLYLDRKVLASMLYYARPQGWDAVIFNPDGHVMNHYELTTTMNGREGKDFLLVVRDPPPPVFSTFFESVEPLAVFRKPIHPTYTLTLHVYRAKGFKGYQHHD